MHLEKINFLTYPTKSIFIIYKNIETIAFEVVERTKCSIKLIDSMNVFLYFEIQSKTNTREMFRYNLKRGLVIN